MWAKQNLTRVKRSPRVFHSLRLFGPDNKKRKQGILRSYVFWVTEVTQFSSSQTKRFSLDSQDQAKFRRHLGQISPILKINYCQLTKKWKYTGALQFLSINVFCFLWLFMERIFQMYNAQVKKFILSLFYAFIWYCLRQLWHLHSFLPSFLKSRKLNSKIWLPSLACDCKKR